MVAERTDLPTEHGEAVPESGNWDHTVLQWGGWEVPALW